MAKRPKINKTPASVFLGKEPMLASVSGRSDPNLPKVLNWYNYQFDNSQAKEWLVKYLNEISFDTKTIGIIKRLPDWAVPATPGWLSKMYLNGTQLAAENKQYIINKVVAAIEKYGKRSSEDKREPTIQDRVALKSNQLFCKYEELIDAFMDTGKTTSMYDFLRAENATPVAASYIKSKYERISSDFNSPDEQLLEAYGKKFQIWKDFYQSLVDDCDRYLGNKKSQKIRTPGVVKLVPKTKTADKVVYKKSHDPLKLVSVPPEKILGANQVWLYNTKYNQLQVYTASDSVSGLSIKGTTVIGFDERIAQSKGLRKPQETLNHVLTATKNQLGGIMASLVSKERPANGRINENTIILRVVS